MTRQYSAIWPEAIIRAALNGDLVIVVGAGVSINSKSDSGKTPPNWSKLVKSLSAVATGKDTPEEGTVELVDSGSLLEAADRVMALATMKNRVADVQREIKSSTEKPINEKPFPENEWHKALLMLSPQVIVTTNYDKLIERASRSGYDVHSYDSEYIAQQLRLGEPVLVKIHGSVDNLDKIIITQTDYSRLHSEGREALKVVQALFLTRTVLFVGYSIEDPDIRLLLQNALGGSGASAGHYMLTSDPDPVKKQMFQSAFGVNVIPYAYSEDHGEGLKALMELAEVVSESMIPG